MDHIGFRCPYSLEGCTFITENADDSLKVHLASCPFGMREYIKEFLAKKQEELQKEQLQSLMNQENIEDLSKEMQKNNQTLQLINEALNHDEKEKNRTKEEVLSDIVNGSKSLLTSFSNQIVKLNDEYKIGEKTIMTLDKTKETLGKATTTIAESDAWKQTKDALKVAKETVAKDFEDVSEINFIEAVQEIIQELKQELTGEGLAPNQDTDRKLQSNYEQEDEEYEYERDMARERQQQQRSNDTVTDRNSIESHESQKEDASIGNKPRSNSFTETFKRSLERVIPLTASTSNSAITSNSPPKVNEISSISTINTTQVPEPQQVAKDGDAQFSIDDEPVVDEQKDIEVEYISDSELDSNTTPNKSETGSITLDASNIIAADTLMSDDEDFVTSRNDSGEITLTSSLDIENAEEQMEKLLQEVDAEEDGFVV